MPSADNFEELKCLNKNAEANSVAPESTSPIKVYAVCHPAIDFTTHKLVKRPQIKF